MKKSKPRWGYGVKTSLENGRQEEHDTYCCAHCQRITVVEPGKPAADMGGVCRQCDDLLCTRCAATGRCDPFEAKLERQIQRQVALRSYGLA